MARKRTESSDAITPLRLRIPASLAIAFLGASATAVMAIGACDPTPEPPPQPDAGELSKTSDAGPDTVLADGDDPLVDASLVDGAIAPTPDAPTPVDAYVPPDTPVG
jgi:hypothetical protein